MNRKGMGIIMDAMSGVRPKSLGTGGVSSWGRSGGFDSSSGLSSAGTQIMSGGPRYNQVLAQRAAVAPGPRDSIDPAGFPLQTRGFHTRPGMQGPPEGMSHGGILGLMRKGNTDFGSPWGGVVGSVKTFNKVFGNGGPIAKFPSGGASPRVRSRGGAPGAAGPASRMHPNQPWAMPEAPASAAPSVGPVKPSMYMTGPSSYGPRHDPRAAGQGSASGLTRQFGGGLGGLGGVAAGATLGAMGGYMAGESPVGGAIAGGAAGGAASYMAGKRAFSGAVASAGRRLGGRGAPMIKQASDVAGMMEDKGNRAAMFGAGAFLGGGAFGTMFGGEGRSHRRGFNRNRGNTFSR